MSFDPDTLEWTRGIIRYRVKRLTGSHGLTASDREDLEQDLLVTVIEQLPKFDERRGRRTTFVSRVVDRRISTILRHRRQQRRNYVRIDGSLNESVTEHDGRRVERSETLARDLRRVALDERIKTDLALDLEQATEGLRPELRRLCELLLTESLVEIATSLGVTRHTVRSWIRELRGHLADAGLHVYLQRGA